MQYEAFLGQVQHRARLASMHEALRATRATLETLAERIDRGEAWDLAAQLPQDLGEHLRNKVLEQGERFDLDEFFRRVSEREGVSLASGTYHARVVIEVLREAVSPGEWRDVEAQLPEDFKRRLLEVGSQGKMPPKG